MDAVLIHSVIVVVILMIRGFNFKLFATQTMFSFYILRTYHTISLERTQHYFLVVILYVVLFILSWNMCSKDLARKKWSNIVFKLWLAKSELQKGKNVLILNEQPKKSLNSIFKSFTNLAWKNFRKILWNAWLRPVLC